MTGRLLSTNYDATMYTCQKLVRRSCSAKTFDIQTSVEILQSLNYLCILPRGLINYGRKVGNQRKIALYTQHDKRRGGEKRVHIPSVAYTLLCKFYVLVIIGLASNQYLLLAMAL